jgi:putative ABC transport system permease protein
MTRAVQFWLHFVLGIPALMLGYFLLGPALVWVTERMLGPAVAWALRLRPALLRQQFSGGLWRAAGTAAALMVGLAVLVGMQVHGRTMLNGWKLPDKFPDIFIVSPLQEMSSADVERLGTVSGIAPGQVMPVALASPQFGTSIFGVAGTAGLVPDSTLFVGVDPERFLSMADMDFMQGNRADALRMLKQGKHILITNEFHQVKGLNVGDKLPLKTPLHGMVDYTVAGVVWSPGVDVIVGLFDMGRQFEQQTVSSVFGTLGDAREDFGAEGVHLVAADLRPGTEREKVLASVKQDLRKWGLLVGDVRQIKYAIQKDFTRLLLLMSTVAFAAMAVASLGVANTVLASVRSRRWQFGILRAVGVTRWQLLRLVMCEAVLLGVVGCALGLLAGFEIALDARGFTGVIIGYAPALSVPWAIVAAGAGVVMLVALGASVWPALSVARAEPLTLLQAGRTAQ